MLDQKDHKYEREASYEDYQIDLDKVYYHKIISSVQKFSKDKKGNLLDVGCFDGTLAAQFLGQRTVYGLEGNIEACNRAKEKGINAQLVDLDKEFPFEDDFFDCVIAAEIIEHVYDTDKFLQEIKRVLKKDGTLVMSIPNVACLSNRIKMLFGGYPRYAEYQAGGAGHIRVYTGTVIKNQLIANGFDVVQFIGCNLPLPMHNPHIPKWLKKFAVKAGDYCPTIAGQVILVGKIKEV